MITIKKGPVQQKWNDINWKCELDRVMKLFPEAHNIKLVFADGDYDAWYIELDCNKGHLYYNSNGGAMYTYAILKDAIVRVMYWNYVAAGMEYIDDERMIQNQLIFNVE